MNPSYEDFIERYKNPRHSGKITGSAHSSVSNVSCGDHISLYVKIGKNGIIEDAKFEGRGCALSTATADILCDYVIGKNINTVCGLDFNRATGIIGFVPSINRVGCVKIVVDALQDICEAYTVGEGKYQ